MFCYHTNVQSRLLIILSRKFKLGIIIKKQKENKKIAIYIVSIQQQQNEILNIKNESSA
jgi:hypothetical protein